MKMVDASERKILFHPVKSNSFSVDVKDFDRYEE
jgi:hypothetical protein